MRSTQVAAMALAVLAVTACQNDQTPAPTAPQQLRMATILAGPACSDALHDQVFAERAALFTGSVLNDAQILFTPVANKCVIDPPLAKELMLVYIQFTIDQFRDNQVLTPPGFTSPAEALVSHWNTMFAFVGYDQPELPASVLGPDGAAGVITQETEGRELAVPGKAAITVPVQDAESGDPRGHLITINPLPPGCLGASNLSQTGPCFQFSANPKASPAFSPKVKVGICEPVAAGEPIPGAIPALGHEEEGQTQITAPGGVYPTFCVDEGEVAAAGSWTGGFGNIAKRLAWVARKAIGVTSAYASHGGLGGVTGGLSPFGAVDLLMFKATFTADVLHDPPGPPEVGSWFVSTDDKSKVRVEKEIGKKIEGLRNKPVVLEKHEHKCLPCVGVLLRGTVEGGSSPENGIYLVSWWSLSQGPDEDDVAFVLRSSDGLEIGRVTYTSVKKPKADKADQLKYNGIVVGSWDKDVKQHFEVTVDMNSHTTSLSIDGFAVAGAQNLSFVESALNLASIGAELRGKDKKVGWDDITITRLADETP